MPMSLKKVRKRQKKMAIKPIKAAGGVAFRIKRDGSCEVLLIYRKEIWDLPKGKLEAGERIEECAIREVSEETGAEYPLLCGILPTTYHEYEMKGRKWGKTTWWYVMCWKSKQSFSPQQEEGIQQIKWVQVDEAVERVGFKNLKETLISFKAKLKV